MKNIITLFLISFGTFYTVTEIQAQCPVIECTSEDVTLYVSESSCTAEYYYDIPVVNDFCENVTTYSYSGETESWVVPEGVTEILVRAWGASGGHGSGPGYELNMGGRGAYVSGRLAVTPGETLYINIGGQGGNAQTAANAEGGWNGGGIGGMDTVYTGNGAGGGGGATDIRIGGNELEHRVLVAAGGGGASKNAPGGAGGTIAGLDGNAVGAGAAGLGGTFETGGIVHFTDRGATSGQLGLGGNGSTNHASWGGGGGGAGFYGGSGGTSTEDHNNGHSGSGGGGSSYTGTATQTQLMADQRIGNGMLFIYFSDSETTEATVVQSLASGSEFPLGTSILTFAAYGAIDTNYCTIQVNVLDTIAPVAQSQNITLQLAEEDVAVITPEDIDNGSYDNCSVANMSIDVTEIGGVQTGDVLVTLTVIDASGNESTSVATVTVTRPPQEFVEQLTFDKGENPKPPAPSRRNISADTETTFESGMVLYPNPVSTGNVELVVELSQSSENAIVRVFSASGKQVINQMVPVIMPVDRIAIPIDGLKPGVYIVQLSTENEWITQRLVIR